jgi:intracellular sulfur oxidation DsrE/DsrF family protein
MSSTPARRWLGSFALIVAFIAALAGAGAATFAATAHAATAHAATAHAAESVPAASANDAWLDNLKGTHRQLFDAPTPNGGIPLVHVMNYYDTYNKAYGAKDKDVNGILTFYGATTFYGLKDEMWAKYRLGEFLETNDQTNKPATANPWRVAPVALGMALPQASIESLQKRGATFIICNNALGIFAGLVAQSRGVSADAVLADFKANILPGVTLVPAMVVAIEKAQGRGISYHRQ